MTHTRRPPEASTSGAESQSPAERAHERFAAITKDAQAALEGPPNRWIPRLYRVLLKHREDLQNVPARERLLLEGSVDAVLAAVRGWSERDPANSPESLLAASQERIHDLERLFVLAEGNKERHALEVRTMSVEALARANPDLLAVASNKDGKTVSFRATKQDAWTSVAVPSMEGVLYKGGLPRILLKIAHGVTDPSLAAEIPMNDIDLIADRSVSPNALTREAKRLGADAEGLELVDSLDWETTLRARDVDLNQAFFGANGLVYSDRAVAAAKSGTLRLESEDRGLYGSEIFYYDGVRMIKNRGMYRLFKFVAEGKADSFELAPINRQVDFGIYWLVLAQKFAKKPNGGALLARLYEIGRRCGQVRADERDIFDVLRRCQATYPFFTFNRAPPTEQEVVKWLAGKLGKMADKHFRVTRGVRSDLSFERKPNDTVPERISLDGFAPAPQANEDFLRRWKELTEQQIPPEDQKIAA